MLIFDNNPNYEIEAYSKTNDDNTLANMVLLYNSIVNNYSIHFNFIDYSLLFDNSENKTILLNDFNDFIDKTHKII